MSEQEIERDLAESAYEPPRVPIVIAVVVGSVGLWALVILMALTVWRAAR